MLPARVPAYQPTNLISEVLLYAWGVAASYTGGAWTNPTMVRTTFVDTTSPANTEYGLCFKCHSSYAYGASPPGSYTDQSLEFNPLNVSRHPVVSAGNNNYCSPTATNGNRRTMHWPWNQTANEHDTMMCSDCHGSVAGDPEGPHGSANTSILQASLVAVVMPGGGNYATPLCVATCHSASVYANNNGIALGSRYKHQENGGMNVKAASDPSGYGGCLMCHGNLQAGVKGTLHGHNDAPWPTGPKNQFLNNKTTWIDWNEAGKTCTTVGGICNGHNNKGPY
ncbi:MAG: hypothetical protein AAB368_00660, partial [bacterium]